MSPNTPYLKKTVILNVFFGLSFFWIIPCMGNAQVKNEQIQNEQTQNEQTQNKPTTSEQETSNRAKNGPTVESQIETTSDPSAGEQNSNDSEAKTNFDLGEKLFAEERYLEAATAFEKAYSLKPHPAVRANIGLSYYKGGDLISAYKVFKSCIEEPAGKEIPQWLQITYQKLDQQLIQLEIVCDVKDCQIQFDGRDLGPSPVTVINLAGNHIAEAFVKNQRLAKIERHFKSGEKSQLILLTVDEPKKEMPKTTVVIKQVNVTRIKTKSFQPGYPFWIAAGATFASAAVTTTFGAMTLRDKKRYDDAEGPADDIRESGENKRLATNIFLGATLTGAATTALIGYFRYQKHKKAQKPKITVAIEPQGGLSLTGKF